MNIWTDEISKGVLSLTVMLMLAVALIAGQARATLHGQTKSTAGDDSLTELHLRFRTESERSDAPLIDALLRLPVDVSFDVGDFSVGTDISIGGSDESNREHTNHQ